MFDTTHLNIGGPQTSVNINAVSGTLTKSDSRSQIIRFHMTSEYAKQMFRLQGPRIDVSSENSYSKDYRNVVVLQVMLCAGDQYLVEFMFADEKKDDK